MIRKVRKKNIVAKEKKEIKGTLMTDLRKIFPIEAYKEINIPEKDDIFICMAFILSQLSKDGQTKCGCIITDNKNRIIGGGYNSFPMGCPDHEIPNVRPYKYPFVLHAESNALAFCSIRPECGIVYLTTEPCLECIKRMWQEGITKVVYAKRDYTYSCPEDIEAKKIIKELSPIEFIEKRPNMDFLVDLVSDLASYGFISNEALSKLKN